jgi:hypothetical protein
MAGLRHVMVAMKYAELTRAISASTVSRVVMHKHIAWFQIWERVPLCPTYGPSLFLKLYHVREIKNIWVKSSSTSLSTTPLLSRSLSCCLVGVFYVLLKGSSLWRLSLYWVGGRRYCCRCYEFVFTISPNFTPRTPGPVTSLGLVVTLRGIVTKRVC